MKIIFKKLEYRFLVERTNFENALFPYKTVISDASVMKNRMMSTKQTYHKKIEAASTTTLFS